MPRTSDDPDTGRASWPPTVELGATASVRPCLGGAV